MSSSDGFCSTLSFAPGELGQPYAGPTSSSHHHTTSISSTNNTPIPTPSQPSPIKPSAILASPITAQPSSAASAQPASPARTNSAGSIATLPSGHQSAANVVNNPTPTLGSVPLVTAVNSSQPPILPLTTPPQTPMSAVSQSRTSSVSGSVLGKRDMQTASESEKEEKDQGSSIQLQQPKKRRIAPTLISGGNDSSKDASHKPDGGG